MSAERTHPVSRPRVAIFGLVLFMTLAGLITLVESLRHPHPGSDPGQAQLDEPSGDPRLPLDCPAPPPREDQPAESDSGDAQPSAGLTLSSELYDCPADFDGRTVRYRGETVGAILHRRDGSWVQLNDDIYAGDLGPLPAHRDFRGGNAGVGVFLPPELAAEISFVGGPKARGDIIEVVGVFHRVDPKAEVAVIHAVDGRIIRQGEEYLEPALIDRQIAAGVAAVLAMALLIVQIRRSRRMP